LCQTIIGIGSTELELNGAKKYQADRRDVTALLRINSNPRLKIVGPVVVTMAQMILSGPDAIGALIVLTADKDVAALDSHITSQ